MVRKFLMTPSPAQMSPNQIIELWDHDDWLLAAPWDENDDMGTNGHDPYNHVGRDIDGFKNGNRQWHSGKPPRDPWSGVRIPREWLTEKGDHNHQCRCSSCSGV